MKTTERTLETRVILKDGAKYLATWSQNFDEVPTVGERVSFPGHVGNLDHLQAYQPLATVAKVQRGKGVRDSYVELQAESVRRFMRSVTLNSGFIPGRQRMDAERQVRQLLPDVRIVWQEGMQPSAVLRMTDLNDFPEDSRSDAQRPRGDTYGERESRVSKVTLEAQLRRMLDRTREAIAHHF